jgi:hypothetical protein
MSAQPIPIAKQEQIAKKQRADFRSDALYVAGAVLVTAGVALIRVRLGLIVGGCFCLLLPLLEIVGSFIKGLRRPALARKF